MSARCACQQCFYCDAQLSVRHEHDHYPLPARVGGKETVPACINCHDLKDRVALKNWRSEILSPAMGQVGPLGRILLARLAAMYANLEKDQADLDQRIADQRAAA